MRFVITGGKPLAGTVAVRGAKNAATKMMVAALLSPEPVHLENFPFIGDTEITAELCRTFGADVVYNDAAGSAHIATPAITNVQALNLTRRNRIPILALGPLLARAGEAIVPIVGGDKIGPRPVDLHLDALRALGARIEERADRYEAHAPHGLSGARIDLKFPSVGATENALLAGVLARGTTTITNAALEPEVVDLIKLLQKMGAIIGLGSGRTIVIEGVPSLHGARHRILPDRNEAVSFGVLGVAAQGPVRVKGATQGHLMTFLNTIRKIGGQYDVQDDGIVFSGGAPLKAVEVETDAHPGFMTDWQQPLSVLLTQAQGTSVVHETIYEDRFGYTDDLNAMGAQITTSSKCLGELPCRFHGLEFKHSAVLHGPTPLAGATMRVRDLRSGMAHVIAALLANGTSVIEGVEEIDRGYEKLDERLRALGASIFREE